jgi:hypothetical protein
MKRFCHCRGLDAHPVPLRIAVWLIWALALAAPTYAQTSRGTVSGTVLDTTGAVIFGSTVELINPDTDIVRTTTTNSAGIYRLDAVDLGMYRIKIGLQGFQTFFYGLFPVEANHTVTIDATLEAGGIDSLIEVTDGMVETSLIKDGPLRGGSFSNTELVKIPFAWMDPFFAGSYPGVMYSGITCNTSTCMDFAVNGQRPRANNFMMDGTDNNDISVGGQFQNFRILDAVQESSTQSANFGVEFGRAGGGTAGPGPQEIRRTLLEGGSGALAGNRRLLGIIAGEDCYPHSSQRRV